MAALASADIQRLEVSFVNQIKDVLDGDVQSLGHLGYAEHPAVAREGDAGELQLFGGRIHMS